MNVCFSVCSRWKVISRKWRTRWTSLQQTWNPLPHFLNRYHALYRYRFEWWFCTQPKHSEYCSWVVSTSTVYPGSPRFRLYLEDTYPNWDFCSFAWSRKMTGYYLKWGYKCFFSCDFHLILYWSSYHSMLCSHSQRPWTKEPTSGKDCGFLVQG